jgi:hypothetical protein
MVETPPFLVFKPKVIKLETNAFPSMIQKRLRMKPYAHFASKIKDLFNKMSKYRYNICGPGEKSSVAIEVSGKKTSQRF